MDQRSDPQPSILAHIVAHVPTDGSPGLAGNGDRLPDERPASNDELSWAPGAFEGILLMHTAQQPAAGLDPAGLLDLIRRSRPGADSHQARERLYALAQEGTGQDVIAAAITQLTAEHLVAPDGTKAADRETARWLAFTGRHRAPVKLGIALLALGHDEADRARLLELARHSEFSLSVLATVQWLSVDRDQAAWSVARVATGWGRVHAVLAISSHPSPEIGRWMVCRGLECRGLEDGVLAAYMAWHIATSAKMLGQLQAIEDTDQELLDGAVAVVATLLGASLHGGPAETLGDYVDAPAALRRLFELLPRHEVRFSLYFFAHNVLRWLAEEGGLDGSRDLVAAVDAFLAGRDWSALALSALVDPEHPRSQEAQRLAESLGHDTFPAMMAALTTVPNPTWHWGAAAHSAGPSRIAEVISLAEAAGADRPPLNGFLSDILSALPADQPGLGWPIVAAGLQSPLFVRAQAIRALRQWDRSRWPPEIAPLLRRLRDEAPGERERKWFSDALGES